LLIGKVFAFWQYTLTYCKRAFMKKILPVVAVAILALSIYAFRAKEAKPAENEANGIQWLTWSEMQEAQKKEPRKVFIDVYTDWCGWCKRMDQTTFTHPEIINYMNSNFYAIKFDAEARENIKFKGKDYKFVASGNRGYNELAAEILNGRLSYPTSVYLDENMDLLFPVPGYLEPKILEQLLHFVGGNNYKNVKFDKFQEQFQGKIE
jgi:thioredoxin-related protein